MAQRRSWRRCLGLGYTLLTGTSRTRGPSWGAVRRRFITVSCFGSLLFVGTGVAAAFATGGARGAVVSGIVLVLCLGVALWVAYAGLRRKYTDANEIAARIQPVGDATGRPLSRTDPRYASEGEDLLSTERQEPD
jgi:hypothetical protein